MHVNFHNNYFNEELGRDVDAVKKSREKTGVVTDWGRQKDRNNIISMYQLLHFFSCNSTECKLGCFCNTTFYVFKFDFFRATCQS